MRPCYIGNCVNFLVISPLRHSTCGHIYLHTGISQTDSIFCIADKFVSTLEVISEEQESITSSPQSVSDTSADEQVEDSQFDETPNNNPEQASDTVLIAPSGNDFKINIIDV